MIEGVGNRRRVPWAAATAAAFGNLLLAPAFGLFVLIGANGFSERQGTRLLWAIGVAMLLVIAGSAWLAARIARAMSGRPVWLAVLLPAAVGGVLGAVAICIAIFIGLMVFSS